MADFPKDLAPVAGRPGWRKGDVGDWLEIERRVLLLQEKVLEPTQVVCGALDRDDGHAIYVIEGISPVELAREFATGSHDAWPGSDTAIVCDELTRIFRVAPFRTYFVDAAGYKARFKSQITVEQAAEIERIVSVGLEGYSSDWTIEDGPNIAKVILAENQIRLWWD